MKRIDLRPFVPLFLAAAGCATPNAADLDNGSDEAEQSDEDSAAPSSGEGGDDPSDEQDPPEPTPENETEPSDTSDDPPPDLGSLPDEVHSAAEYAEWRHELYCAVYSTCYGEAGADACYESSIPWGGDECQLVDLSRANTCLDEAELALAELPDEPTTAECEAAMIPEACENVLYDSGDCGGGGEDDGRPIRQGGQPLLARVTSGEAWSHAVGQPEAHVRASQAWLYAARSEHGSIQAFSRLSQELMFHGAPPSLITRCHQAALDEIEHAQLCLDLARRLGAEDADLGAIDLPATRRPTLATMAIEALEEGCWGEGVAAIRAGVAASRCSDPFRATLRQIASDETRHAQLAWSTLGFFLRRDPNLAAVLLDHLDVLRARVAGRVAVGEGDDLSAYGLLAATERRMLSQEVLDQIVAPTLRALIGQVTRAGAAAYASAHA